MIKITDRVHPEQVHANLMAHKHIADKLNNPETYQPMVAELVERMTEITERSKSADSVEISMVEALNIIILISVLGEIMVRVLEGPSDDEVENMHAECKRLVYALCGAAGDDGTISAFASAVLTDVSRLCCDPSHFHLQELMARIISVDDEEGAAYDEQETPVITLEGHKAKRKPRHRGKRDSQTPIH